MAKLFPENPVSCQLFELDIDLVVTSCGMGVPYFDYREECLQLNNLAERKGNSGKNDYTMKKIRSAWMAKLPGISEE